MEQIHLAEVFVDYGSRGFAKEMANLDAFGKSAERMGTASKSAFVGQTPEAQKLGNAMGDAAQKTDTLGTRLKAASEHGANLLIKIKESGWREFARDMSEIADAVYRTSSGIIRAAEAVYRFRSAGGTGRWRTVAEGLSAAAHPHSGQASGAALAGAASSAGSALAGAGAATGTAVAGGAAALASNPIGWAIAAILAAVAVIFVTFKAIAAVQEHIAEAFKNAVKFGIQGAEKWDETRKNTGKLWDRMSANTAGALMRLGQPLAAGVEQGTGWAERGQRQLVETGERMFRAATNWDYYTDRFTKRMNEIEKWLEGKGLLAPKVDDKKETRYDFMDLRGYARTIQNSLSKSDEAKEAAKTNAILTRIEGWLKQRAGQGGDALRHLMEGGPLR